MLNWTRRITSDGVVFYPPEGREAAGALRLREYVRPLARLRDIRTEQVSRLSSLGTVEVTAPTHEITSEGEHAVLYQVRVRGASLLELHVGVTFGDDGYLLAEGMCGDPELSETFAAVTRRLTLHLPLGLGSDRRRRYLYKRPPDWQAVVKRHSVVWYPPDYPCNHSVIHVFDAIPGVTPDKPHTLDRLVLMEPQNTLQSFTDSDLKSILTDTGLHGAYEVLRGTWMGGVPAAIVKCGLVDKRFGYHLRLEASGPGIDAAQAVFVEVARSVTPVPLAVQTQPQAAVIHWIE
jgi:hypothetical protein